MFEAITIKTASYFLSPLYFYFGASIIAQVGVAAVWWTGGMLVSGIKYFWRRDSPNYFVFRGEKIKIEPGYEYRVSGSAENGVELTIKKMIDSDDELNQ